VVSPGTTLHMPEGASFSCSRISSVSRFDLDRWSRFCENPCMALGTPCTALWAQCFTGGDHQPAANATRIGEDARSAEPRVLRGDNHDRIFSVGGLPELEMVSCQRGGSGGTDGWSDMPGSPGGRRAVHDQIHPDRVAVRTLNHLPPPVILIFVGGQRAFSSFAVDSSSESPGLRESTNACVRRASIAGRNLQKISLCSPQLLLAVEQRLRASLVTVV